MSEKVPGSASQERDKVYGNAGPAETPTTSCIMQQKSEMMFVSEYFLIFIRYIFRLNWNLSGRIGHEWHHSSSWAVPPRLMRCNKEKKRKKEREREREKEVDCRVLNEMQFGVNGSQKHITASMA